MKWVTMDEYCSLHDLSEEEVFDLYSLGVVDCRNSPNGTLVKLPDTNVKAIASKRRGAARGFICSLATLIEAVCNVPTSDKEDELLMFDDGISNKSYRDGLGMSYERDANGKLRDEFGRRLD